MSTTTIRLPDDLKEKVANAAKRAGKTAHAFILDAIAARIDEDRRREDFEELAEKRFAAILASGKTVEWPQMRRYLEARLTGKPARRPSPRKLTRQ